MLQVQSIRANKAEIIERLAKRGKDFTTAIESVLDIPNIGAGGGYINNAIIARDATFANGGVGIINWVDHFYCISNLLLTRYGTVIILVGNKKIIRCGQNRLWQIEDKIHINRLGIVTRQGVRHTGWDP